jgi:hypothetical protein
MAERQRTPEEIRRDIERTRADMDETVQAIGDRMSPGQIIDQVWDKVRSGDAAASFGQVVKEHPMPALLMGLGLGWLVYERNSMTEGERLRRKHGEVGPGTYAPAEGRVGPYTGEELGLGETSDGFGDRARSALASVKDAASNVGEKLSGAAASVGERVGSVRESTSERTSQLRESTSERMHHMRERADELKARTGERVQHARQRAGELSHRAKDGVSRAYDEQPLALGAVAFGLGLASGLVVPSTRWEDETVGRKAEHLRGELKRTGSETLESAKRVAEEAKNTARDVIEREGVLDDLKEKAKHIAEETRTAAARAADREGLSTESIMQRARSGNSERGTPQLGSAEAGTPNTGATRGASGTGTSSTGATGTGTSNV